MCRSLRVLPLLASLALLPGNAAAQGPGEPASKPPSADKDQLQDRIRWLLAQLGSVRFAEREAASQALGEIGVPALGALREAVSRTADPEVRRRAAALVERLENTLGALALDYAAGGLPLPPKDAPLVLFGDSRKPEDRWLAFLAKPATKRSLPVLLEGFREYTLYLPEVVKNTDLRGLTPAQLAAHKKAFVFSEDGIALACQCKIRGWPVLAEAVFEAALAKSPGKSPRTAFLEAAWHYWHRQLTEAATDWAAIYQRMKALHAGGKVLDTRENRELVVSLEAALVPGKGRPGTVEVLIDDLIQARAVSELAPGWKEGDPLDDPRVTRLIDMGFTAVPDLIDHLDDNRLTRHFEIRWGAGGAGLAHMRHCRVSDLVGTILARLSHRVGRGSSKAEAQAWWAEAQKEGEEAYFLARIFPEDGKDKGPDPDLLRIIALKYPRHLPRIYRTVLEERPDAQGRPLAEAVRMSSLPRETKVSLLVGAAERKELWHRIPALIELKGVARARFLPLMLGTLEAVLKKTLGDGEIAHFYAINMLRAQIATPEEWRALEKAAREADVGLRLEYLTCGSLFETDEEMRGWLHFLAGFLDDSAVRDVRSDPRNYQKPFAGEDYPRLEVRNFAAMQMGRILDLSDEPKPTWTPDQWARFREQVRKAMAR